MQKVQFKRFPVACLAPSLSDEKLATYRTLIDTIGNPEIKEAATTCLTAVAKWWELPESTSRPSAVVEVAHRTSPTEKRTAHEIPVVDLEHQHVQALWEFVPWLSECERMKELFDVLTGDVRDMCFHLLWFCIELTLDREPITQDKIRKA